MSFAPFTRLRVAQQCADCRFISEDTDDFRRHFRRKVHRDAVAEWNRRAALAHPATPSKKVAGEEPKDG